MSSSLVRRRVSPDDIDAAPYLSSSRAALLAIIRRIDAAAALVCNDIDKALELEHEERPALKDLRKGVENLKSSVVAFNVLLSASDIGEAAHFNFIMYVIWLHMLKELIIHNITEWTKRNA